jgi:hypothetical protein
MSAATRPDFARTDAEAVLSDRDLRFLMRHFPEPGKNYEDIARIIDTVPITVESMLASDFVLQKILDRRQLLLDVSPFLLFSVLLRHTLKDHRSRLDRRVLNYLANLLSLFARSDRLYRVTPGGDETYAYLSELVAAAAEADTRRRFLIHSHIGNYALFIAGLFPRWIEHRHRYGRRPVDRAFYLDFGRAYYQQVAQHPMAREIDLDDVFLRLALVFDQYVASLNRMTRRYLTLGA